MKIELGDTVFVDGKHKAQVLSIDYHNGEAFVRFDDRTSTTSSPWVRLDRLSAVTLPIGNQPLLNTTHDKNLGWELALASEALKSVNSQQPYCPVVTAHIRKCECGSHKAGSDRHSDYCPLYVK